MDFDLQNITHHPGREPPLAVKFRAGGETHTIDCEARDVQTFAAFQRLVANALGIWLADQHEGDRRATALWQSDVSEAFDAGRRP